MSVLIVIPARFASSRYPAKPLAQLKGATGTSRSLIRRSWDAAMSVNGADRVVVATDDVRIADHAAAFGAEVVMTAESCRNGTERCAEAHDRLGGGYEIVVNLQGDAPLTPACCGPHRPVPRRTYRVIRVISTRQRRDFVRWRSVR